MVKVMNKVFGKKTDFAPIKEDASRVIISYGYQEVDKENATWYEIYLYKKQVNQVSLADVKAAIIADINKRTDEKILGGFEYTPDGTETSVKVWLSSENQFNFKAAFDLAIQTEGATLPVTFKLGETEDGTPVYHEFATIMALQAFYSGAVAYINQALAEGWQEKDGIDWTQYETFFPVTENQ